eukprot:GEMP01030698.1.p2 GENE.GEMP01030698.1~~GEMP01030698.1.p2  ORF type:complete len:164 (-),score=30.17 GEMP01030698.1:676-1167(-)
MRECEKQLLDELSRWTVIFYWITLAKSFGLQYPKSCSTIRELSDHFINSVQCPNLEQRSRRLCLKVLTISDGDVKRERAPENSLQTSFAQLRRLVHTVKLPRARLGTPQVPHERRIRDFNRICNGKSPNAKNIYHDAGKKTGDLDSVHAAKFVINCPTKATLE